MADKRTNIIFRFGIVYSLIVIAFILVVIKIFVIITVERNNWLALQDKGVKTDIIVKPKRGNIYACDGRLMASSIPTYRIYMDTRVESLRKDKGKLFYENVDSVALCLSKLFKDKPVSEYKSALTKAYRDGNRRFPIYPNRIPYYQWKAVQAFPLFRQGRNKSGLFSEEYVQRKKPFGSLASRTIGDVYADETKGGRSGLEQYYDKVLTGQPGFSVRQKLANTWQEVTIVEPVDGMDIVTTIDIDIQDISEHSLLEILEKYHAKSGYVMIMETKTGEIRSIVNMYRGESGEYSEKENGAVSDMMEPGSTFKTMVLMAALDEGKVKSTDSVDVGDGRLKYHSRVPEVTDHNADKGGYGKISVANVIHGSSNVGMHKIVYNAYGKNQAELVDKLREMKLTTPMKLEIKGAGEPSIKHPDENKDWSPITSLSAISRGYEIIMPPVYTLAFYNAIANDGEMIRPLFVKSINKDGQVVKSYETETINSSICKSSTLKTIQNVLLGVVEGEMGTAKPVRSDIMHIAGKTGTARVTDERGKYMNNRHRLSFCGYFPADNPQYTGIVVVNEPVVPSAGLTSGIVFKNIAERTMALKSKIEPKKMATDSFMMAGSIVTPRSKGGNYKALQTVMKNIHLSMSGKSSEWVKTAIAEDEIKIAPLEVDEDAIPDVRGLGAKDAVYLLEKLGLNVNIQGRGKVVSQSILQGTPATKGRRIELSLK